MRCRLRRGVAFFAGIQVGAQLVTGDARHALDFEYALGGDHAAREPAGNRPLGPEIQGARERGLSADCFRGGSECITRVHRAINAETVTSVNAHSVKKATHYVPMAHATTDPSEFWLRLTQAMTEKKLPTTQNGVATKLKMSQGSVRRWYTGDGLPELKTVIELAQMTGYCVEWLLTGRGPEKPNHDPDLADLIRHWKALGNEGRMHVLRTAKLEHAMNFTGNEQERMRVQEDFEAYTAAMRSRLR